MDEHPQNKIQSTDDDERVVPPLVSAPLLTAVLLFLVLPLFTWIVVLLMWALAK